MDQTTKTPRTSSYSPAEQIERFAAQIELALLLEMQAKLDEVDDIGQFDCWLDMRITDRKAVIKKEPTL